MRRFAILPAGLLLLLAGCDPDVAPDPAIVDVPEAQVSKERGDGDGNGGGGERGPIIRQDLPGTWRPFSDDSPWNTPIAADAPTHHDSPIIIGTMATEASNLRFTRSYMSPIWVVDSSRLESVIVRSDRIFDTWDQDRDGWSDVGVPLAPSMWAEPTSDAHIIIVDPFRRLAWEMSRFGRLPGGIPTCTTFNIWELDGRGHGDSNEGRWQRRGGRGSGFPVLAGMIRPEEIAAGEIRHALVFTFSQNRAADDSVGCLFMQPPACRGDGQFFGAQYPIEGMRFQLSPLLGEGAFDAMGLTREGKVVARALQTYGMYDGDSGGAMALELQLLGPTADENRRKWDELFPGFYKTVEKIPTLWFRAVETVEPTIRY